MSKGERKIADYVLSHNDSLALLSVSELAKKTGTSSASVTRFCNRLSFNGYREFRLHLARESGSVHNDSAQLFEDVHIRATDDLESIPGKLIQGTIQALEKTLAVFDQEEFKRAVYAIQNSRRIDIYGVSNSATIGLAAEDRFIRIGKRCQLFSDVHQQIMAASALGADDVAIGISHSGRTRETVEALKKAKENGATTICIVNFPLSPITQFADIKLLTTSFQTYFESDSIVSRISQLALIDIIFMGVVLQEYDQYEGMISNIETALENKLL